MFAQYETNILNTKYLDMQNVHLIQVLNLVCFAKNYG